jgi:hypothetical protein
MGQGYLKHIHLDFKNILRFGDTSNLILIRVIVGKSAKFAGRKHVIFHCILHGFAVGACLKFERHIERVNFKNIYVLFLLRWARSFIFPVSKSVRSLFAGY